MGAGQEKLGLASSPRAWFSAYANVYCFSCIADREKAPIELPVMPVT